MPLQIPKIENNTKTNNQSNNNTNQSFNNFNTNMETLDLFEDKKRNNTNTSIKNIKDKIDTVVKNVVAKAMVEDIKPKGNQQYFKEIDPLIRNSGKLTNEEVQKGNYFDYSDTTRLSDRLSDVLSPKEIKEINDKIKENVDYAGRGTGAGAAAAATTLIMELKKRGIVLPYYYGGGHSNRTTGVDKEWGKDVSAAAAGTEYREKWSMDCSGFVCWAMCTAGIDETPKLASSYYDASKKIPFSEASPGDLLVKSDHVVMVIDSYPDKDGEIHLICAEATGDFATEANYDSDKYSNKVKPDYEGGVILNDYTATEASKYSIIDMDSYYEKNSNTTLNNENQNNMFTTIDMEKK